MLIDLQWYVVRTRPRIEKKIAHHLTKKGIESFYPVQRILKPSENKQTFLEAPLFPSLIFVYTNAEKLPEIKKINGIINPLYRLDKPAVVQWEDMAGINKMVNEFCNIQVHQISLAGDPIQADTPDETVKVFLPTLGYALVAPLENRVAEACNLLPEAGAVEETMPGLNLAWK